MPALSMRFRSVADGVDAFAPYQIDLVDPATGVRRADFTSNGVLVESVFGNAAADGTASVDLPATADLVLRSRYRLTSGSRLAEPLMFDMPGVATTLKDAVAATRTVQPSPARSGAYSYRTPLLTSAMTEVARSGSPDVPVSQARVIAARLPSTAVDSTDGFVRFTLYDTDSIVPQVGSVLRGGPGTTPFHFQYSGHVHVTSTVLQGIWVPRVVVWLEFVHKADAAKGLPADITTVRAFELETSDTTVSAQEIAFFGIDLNIFSGTLNLARDVDGTIGLQINLGMAVWETGTLGNIDQSRWSVVAEDYVLNLTLRGTPVQPAVDTVVNGVTVKARPSAAADRPLTTLSLLPRFQNCEALFWQAAV